MDERITIQRPIIGENVSNENAEEGWEDVAKVWAEVIEKSGSEAYRAEKLTAVTVADFRIRYMTGLNETMRLVRPRNSKIYGIQAIIDGARKGYTFITAESGGEYVETTGEPEFTTEFTTELNA